MWVPGCLIHAVAALSLFGLWLGSIGCAGKVETTETVFQRTIPRAAVP
jgi:hypothetical protein